MVEYKYYSNGDRLTLFESSRDKLIRGSLQVIIGAKLLKDEPQPPVVVLDNPEPKIVIQKSQPKAKLTPFELRARRISELTQPVTPKIVETPVVPMSKPNIFKKMVNFLDEILNLLAGLPSKFHNPFALNVVKVVAIVSLLVALGGYTYAFLPVLAAEIGSKITTQKPVVPTVKPAPSVYLPPFASPNSAPIAVDLQDFLINIPKINLESNIIANVDPNSPEAYKIELQNGVAHAKGSYLPGEDGPVVLFAHSTDTVANILKYNAKFFGVKDLIIGDEIQIEFNHRLYRYVIEDKKIINPDDLDSVRDSKSDLVLSTCYPPGTSWQRLITFARLVS